METQRWYIKFPVDVYALGPVAFSSNAGEKEVRKWAREWDGCKRLPRGFECWRTND